MCQGPQRKRIFIFLSFIADLEEGEDSSRLIGGAVEVGGRMLLVLLGLVMEEQRR